MSKLHLHSDSALIFIFFFGFGGVYLTRNSEPSTSVPRASDSFDPFLCLHLGPRFSYYTVHGGGGCCCYRWVAFSILASCWDNYKAFVNICCCFFFKILSFYHLNFLFLKIFSQLLKVCFISKLLSTIFNSLNQNKI